VGKIARELIGSGKAVHAYLGVQIDATATTARLAAIQPNTAAAKAGLKAGDVITAVDGHQVASGDDLSRIVDTYKPGDSVSVTYTRNGSSHTTTVTLGTRPS
jgi:putative serine protease PepD